MTLPLNALHHMPPDARKMHHGNLNQRVCQFMYMRSAISSLLRFGARGLLGDCLEFTRLASSRYRPSRKTGLSISSGSEPGPRDCALFAPGGQLLLVHACRVRSRTTPLAAQDSSRQSDLRQAGRVACG